jgi:hypothetical protein
LTHPLPIGMVRLLGVSAATVCVRGRVDAAQLNLLLPVILVAGTSFVFQTSSGIFIGFVGWVSLVTVFVDDTCRRSPSKHRTVRAHGTCRPHKIADSLLSTD